MAKSTKGISISQRKYALELISGAGLSGSKPAIIPLDQHVKFTSPDYDKLFHITGDSPLPNPIVFPKLIGRLLYLCMTGPDLSYSVNILSQFMHNPK